MKNKNLLLWYLWDFRVIVGILILLTAIFGSSNGEYFRSAWDNSLQYKRPIDGEMKAYMYSAAACALFFGIRGKYRKLKQSGEQ